MALDPVVNFFQSEIATLPVSDSGVTIVISSGDGAKLPNPAVDGAFNLTIYKEGDPFASPEIVRVTARSTDTLTVTRAQEGSIATTKTEGSTWKVVMFPTAKTIQDIDSTKVNVADIVDNLTSTDTNKPLSANQGKVLQDNKVATASIVNDLTSGGTTVPLSAEQGKVLQDGKVAKAGDTMTGTLTATKLIPSGNVTAGNGMYLPATNTVAFSTDGSERVRVDASGNVGIGESSPAMALNVNSRALQVLLNNTNGAGVRVTSSNTNTELLSGNNLAFLYVTTNSPLAIGTNNTERLRITSAGDVGIGTTSPSQRLEVSGGTAQFNGGGIDSSLGDAILFGNTSFPAIQKNRIRSSISGAAANNLLVFETSNGTVGSYNANQFVLSGSGNVGIGTSSPASALHVTGLTRSTSGINFNASGGSTLSSYEEGTWTPVWAFSTSGSVTLSVDYARYTRIGNIVNVRAGFFTTAISSPVGDATITGLPFAHAETGGRDCPGTIATLLRWNTDMPNLNMCIGSGSVLNFRKNATNSESLTSLLGSDFSATSGNRNVISISITYRV